MAFQRNSKNRLLWENASRFNSASEDYTGIIKRIHHEAPKEYKIKPILSVLDENPIVSETQLKFWRWMADYYLCSEGDVMNAALPAVFKLESETSILLHPSSNDDFTNLTDKEYLVTEALTTEKELTIGDVSKIFTRKPYTLLYNHC